MGRIVVIVLAVIGGLSMLAFLALVGVIVAAIHLAPRETPLPASIVLQADLDQNLAEGGGGGFVSRALFGEKPSLRDFLDALERAGERPAGQGPLCPARHDALGLAAARRCATRSPRSAPRASSRIAFADSFGEFGPGTRPYYLATAFDEIWLQPLGSRSG